MKHILKFTSEVPAYCERQGISPLSLSVRVLKSSYALDRIERISSRLGESMTKLQAEMDSRRSRTIPSGQIRVVIRTVEPDLEALVI